jgi:hypothetical protein
LLNCATKEYNPHKTPGHISPGVCVYEEDYLCSTAILLGMETAYIISLLNESIYLISVLSLFFIIGLIKGRYTLINIIFALYLALLLMSNFPTHLLNPGEDPIQNAGVTIALFVVMTIAGFFLFRRHIPGDDFVKAFEYFGKKVILTLLATSLVMVFSYTVLPVTEFIHPDTPLQPFFASESYFFWWLLAPLVILFFI